MKLYIMSPVKQENKLRGGARGLAIYISQKPFFQTLFQLQILALVRAMHSHAYMIGREINLAHRGSFVYLFF